TIGRNQASPLLERLAVGRRRINTLGSRVDRPVGDLWIFRPVRDQTPAQRIQASLSGFRIVPHSQYVLARSNVPTDRQVSSGRDRNVVTPGQFFLSCGSFDSDRTWRNYPKRRIARQVISTHRSHSIPGAVRTRARIAVEDLNEGTHAERG